MVAWAPQGLRELVVEMQVFTSYFGNLKNLPPNIVPISICGKAPQFWNGIQYKKLAPKYSFFAEWKKTRDNEYYIERFSAEVLDTLSANDVLAELSKMSNGSDVALACYETPSDFCHRNLVAEWLSKQLGINVVEFDKGTTKETPFRVIVGGDLDFTDYEMLSAHIDKLLTFISMKKSIQIVCGGARGADSLGERYALERGYNVTYFSGDWDNYGESAGEDADALVVFWDGDSVSTRHMIEAAHRHGFAIRIKHY